MYDMETIVDTLDLYYQNSFSYNKMENRLKYMNNIVDTNINTNITTDIHRFNKIIIKKIYNEKPFLQNSNDIVININDHILIDGLSGSGKTSILYFLKGIINVDNYIIEPSLDIIKNKCFITLPNNKSLYSGRLCDIITNYSDNPNIEVIKTALVLANLEKYTKIESFPNTIIDVETISAGEYTRLLVARIIYTVEHHNYDILLFDEIDTHLNDEMAIVLCKTLLKIFINNTILYITHNNSVKKYFNKNILVVDGIITMK